MTRRWSAPRRPRRFPRSRPGIASRGHPSSGLPWPRDMMNGSWANSLIWAPHQDLTQELLLSHSLGGEGCDQRGYVRFLRAGPCVRFLFVHNGNPWGNLSLSMQKIRNHELTGENRSRGARKSCELPILAGQMSLCCSKSPAWKSNGPRLRPALNNCFLAASGERLAGLRSFGGSLNCYS